MINPLHAKYYADRCLHRLVRVLHRRQLARDTFLVRLACPEIASRIVPGQFLMLRAPQRDHPLLGRAFAMYDVGSEAAGDDSSVDIVFHVVGQLTALLAKVEAGDCLEAWGPLGNGFLPQPANHLVLVAGGIGQTPFLSLAKELLGKRCYGDRDRGALRVGRITLCYGARSAEYFAGVADFEGAGVDVVLATDDGSAGHHGLVTEVLPAVLEKSPGETRIECCGPEPMMKAVAKIAGRQGVPCRVSLETPMACGLGICFSCVTRIAMDDGTYDYKRTCVDGPVFDASRVVWQ